MSSNLSTVFQQNTFNYPDKPPFNPPVVYPEFMEFLSADNLDKTNEVYSSIRESFFHLEYDLENYNKEKWNPLAWLIKAGETVFIKPNMIVQKHKYTDEWNFVITHGSIIRAVIDYIFLAMGGEGRVIIGDAPQTDSNFIKIIELMGLKEIRDVYKDFDNFEFEIVNLQDEYWKVKNGIYIDSFNLPGDPRGRIEVNLKNDSMFSELDGKSKKYYGAFYDTGETNNHHKNGRHEYAISKSPIIADIFINLPKLKTHKKCGITVNLKGLVGINSNKNWLPHYAFGSPEAGGDQFPTKNKKTDFENILITKIKNILLKKNKFIQFLARRMRKYAYWIFGENKNVIRSGNWYGNDTVWRMALDLNRILFYAGPNGEISIKKKPKRFLSIVDGIVSMEGDGPTSGVKKETGIIVCGDNPVSVDAVCAKLMGFDYKKISIISRAFEPHKYPLVNFEYDQIKVVSNKNKWNKLLKDFSSKECFEFKPHFGWVGHIEDNEAT